MSDRAQRIEVFNDTQDWIKNDPALSASIPVAKKNTMATKIDHLKYL